MDFSPDTIRLILQALIILLLSIAVHEFGHAIVAHKLGDRLPASQGRVTLNPLAHADPFGTLLFPLIGLVVTQGTSYGFGWGRPVEVSPVSFSRRFTMRTGHMMVAAAGPVMNLLFGTVIAIIHVALLATGVIADKGGISLNMALEQATLLNFILMFFNLLPAPPLDGSAVLKGLLSPRALRSYERFEPYAFWLLVAVICIPALRQIFVIPAKWLHAGLYELLTALFGAS